MEPFSAAASVLSILDIAFRTTSALVAYAHDTHGASTEIKLLADESNVLLSILKKLNDRAKDAPPGSAWFEEHAPLIRQFKGALDDLCKFLNLDPTSGQFKKESRLRTIRIAAKWSFSKTDIYTILERITRLQQHSNTLLIHDQRWVEAEGRWYRL